MGVSINGPTIKPFLPAIFFYTLMMQVRGNRVFPVCPKAAGMDSVKIL
jgi:hypothetical protein